MESLESKIERLTPEQRREMEDFVDFLLLKNNFSQNPPAVSSPFPVLMNAPPVLSVDPAPSVQMPASQMQDVCVHEKSPLLTVSPDPVSSTIHEITDNDEDGYMDYGRFESAAPPATEAVKNVKRKIIAKETEDKSRHLLDWVD